MTTLLNELRVETRCYGARSYFQCTDRREAIARCDIKQKQNTKQTQHNVVLFHTCGQHKTRARRATPRNAVVIVGLVLRGEAHLL